MESEIDVNLALLKYVNINVEGVGQSIRALADGGAELSVINNKMLHETEYVPLGKVCLRGIVGNPVSAEIANLQIRLSGSVDKFIPIMFAVCSDINEDCILTEDVVNRLYNSHNVKLLTTNVSQLADAPSVKNDQIMNTEEDDHLGNRAEFQNVDDISEPRSELGKASAELLCQEQHLDTSLDGCRDLAMKNKGGYYIRDGLLFHIDTVSGYSIEQLCVPIGRRAHVLQLAHDSFGHNAMKGTRDRIRLSGLYWPSLTACCKKYCESCSRCQLRSRTTCFDRVPIKAIPRADQTFSHWFMDCLTVHPPTQEKVLYPYCLLLVDSASRWPAAFPIKNLTARTVCDALLSLWMQTGMPAGLTVSSDNGTNFTAALTREFMNRFGCSPRFNTPNHPQATGLVERSVGTIKNMISKMAYSNPSQWHKYLPFVLFAIREIPADQTGIPPFAYVYGHLPRGPLAVLRETWTGDRDLPLNLGKSAEEFLNDLKHKLEVAKEFAQEHTEGAQNRYVSRYNLRARNKSFTVGEKCMILSKDSTANKVFAIWKGPAEILEVKSPHSYVVDLNGISYHVHANKLKKFHVRVHEVICDSILLFKPESEDLVSDVECNSCAIIYDCDNDFGDIKVIEPQANDKLPSQQIAPEAVDHLSHKQRLELFNLLDQYADCFVETPGYCDLVEHQIPLMPGFRPKRLKEYRIPDSLQPEVDRQIAELLRLGFIRLSNSPMASPVVCVLKGKPGDECRPVRITVNYQYVNKFTVPDVIPLPDVGHIIQKMGRARYISVYDARSGYHQCPVRKEDQWLTAFVCGSQLYEWTRCPFGMRSSGCTFVRAIQQIIEPLRDFTEAYVDELAVYSDNWSIHLRHTRDFLSNIRASGLTLNLSKSYFAKPEMKFIGHLVGSGHRRVDPDKVSSIMGIKIPETKKQVRQIIGLFSFFREYLPNFSHWARPLTDLTGKRVPNRIPWGQEQQNAFDKLKSLLCDATTKPLLIIDSSQPFNIAVDASEYSVGGILTQTHEGNEQPVAFISAKLTPTQRRWSVIEKEA
jgi:hypothetical protein